MKEYLQENYKKIISYMFVVIAVISVLATGLLAIKKVQNTETKAYQVHGQYETVLNPYDVKNPECYSYEFCCVGENITALVVETYLWELTSGPVLYYIEDAEGNILLNEGVEIQNLTKPGYDGVWVDVSDLNLKQGENYKLTMSFAWVENALVRFEDFKITVMQVFEYNYASLYTVIVIGLMVFSLLWLYFVYKRGYDTKLYFITSLVVGILVIILMPPANRDDEYRHFLRAYMDVKGIEAEVRLSTGQESGLNVDNPLGEYMIDVPHEINELRLMGYRDNYNGFEYRTEVNEFLCLDKLVTMLKTEPVESQCRVSVAGVSFKSPASYWPQVLGMKLAEVFAARDLILYYVARFGQLIACLLMEVLSMKLAPRMKEMIWLLAFIPNAFILKASCNPDGLMTAEIFLLAAIVIWMKEEKIDFMSKKGMLGCLLYLALSYNIMLMKFPYILISLGLLVYLEKDNAKTAWEWIKSHKKSAIGIAGITAIVGVLGLEIAKNTVLTFVYAFLPETHITYMMAHPGEIFQLFIEKWGFMCVNLLSGMNGEFFIPYAIFVFAILIMMKKQLPAKKRIWFGVLFGMLIMVIVLAGYSLSPADYGAIEEIGYRYLLPFLVVGAMALPSGNEKTEKYARQLMPLAIFVNVTTTMVTWIVGWSV